MIVSDLMQSMISRERVRERKGAMRIENKASNGNVHPCLLRRSERGVLEWVRAKTLLYIFIGFLNSFSYCLLQRTYDAVSTIIF